MERKSFGFSTVNVKHNIYSVDSRSLVNASTSVTGKLEVWHGGQMIERIPGCADRADIISSTGTSSIRWCASRRVCSLPLPERSVPRVLFASPTTICASSTMPGGTDAICADLASGSIRKRAARG